MARRSSVFGGLHILVGTQEPERTKTQRSKDQENQQTKSRERSRHRRHRRKERPQDESTREEPCPQTPACRDSGPAKPSKGQSSRSRELKSSVDGTQARSSKPHKSSDDVLGEDEQSQDTTAKGRSRKTVLKPSVSRTASSPSSTSTPAKPTISRTRTEPMSSLFRHSSHRPHRHHSSDESKNGIRRSANHPRDRSERHHSDGPANNEKRNRSTQDDTPAYPRRHTSSTHPNAASSASAQSTHKRSATSQTRRATIQPAAKPSSSASKTHRPGVSRSKSTSAVPQKPSPSSSSKAKPVPTLDCLTCCETLPASRIITLPCGHSWCPRCIRVIFKSSLTDPTQMPPKCCDNDQPIPIAPIQHLFNRDFKQRFNRKLLEHETKDRIYCPRKSCGAWIRPKHTKYRDRSTGKTYAQCSRCDMKACPACSGKFHPSTQECPNDPALAELKNLASKEGWQRCYQCKAMVELQSGCNHMTCRCGAEFCMLCGTRWRECNCVMFNDDYIDELRHQEREGGGRAGGLGPPGGWGDVVWDFMFDNLHGFVRNGDWVPQRPGVQVIEEMDGEDDVPALWRARDHNHAAPRPRERGWSPRPRRRAAWPEDIDVPAAANHHRRPAAAPRNHNLDPDEELAHWVADMQLRGEDPEDEWADPLRARGNRDHGRIHRANVERRRGPGDQRGAREDREGDDANPGNMGRDRGLRANGAGVNVMDFLDSDDDF